MGIFTDLGNVMVGAIERDREITKEDLTRKNLEQVTSHVDVDASIDEIEEFLERKPLWYESTVKSVNKIYELFPNKKYKFHN